MEFQAFDNIIGYLGAFSCATFALSLFLHPHREKLHIFLGLMLASLAGGLASRSISWQLQSPVMLSAAYFFFSVFPLFLALFIERLVGRHISPYFKIIFFFALVTFATTCWVRPIRLETAWKVLFMVYHVSSLSYLLYTLRTRATNLLQRQEQHVYRAIFYCTALGLFLTTLEWLYAIGPMSGERVRLSAFATLVFVHCLVNIYSNENEFCFLKELKMLSAFMLFSLLGAYILSHGGAAKFSEPQFNRAASLLFACTLCFSALYTQAAMAMGSGLSDHVRQLVNVGKDSIPQFVRDLHQVPELRRISVATQTEVNERDCAEAFQVLTAGVVLTRISIKAEIGSGHCSPDRRDALEAADYLLQTKGAEGVTAIGDSGDLLLASPLAMRSIRHFEALMLWAAENLAFLYKRRAEVTPTFPLIRDTDRELNT